MSRGVPALAPLLECAGALLATVLGEAALGNCLRAGALAGSHSGNRLQGSCRRADAGGEAGSVRSGPGDLPVARAWCQGCYLPLLPAQLARRGNMAAPSCASWYDSAPFRGHSTHITVKGNRFKGTRDVFAWQAVTVSLAPGSNKFISERHGLT